MSNTPRTDAQLQRISIKNEDECCEIYVRIDGKIYDGALVDSDFARRLEAHPHARWVADLMRADGVTAEQVTPDLALAYFDEVGRRIEKLQTTCLTQPAARDAMLGLVRSWL